MELSGPALEIWYLSQRIKPLAEFQRVHKPKLATLRIFASDYALLLKHPAAARQYGFMLDDEEIWFGDFMVIHEGEIRGQNATAP